MANRGVANRVVGCWQIAQRLAQRLVGWRSLGWLVRWLTGWLAGWLADNWRARWLIGCLAYWIGGWLVGWLGDGGSAGWLAGWLAPKIVVYLKSALRTPPRRQYIRNGL